MPNDNQIKTKGGRKEFSAGNEEKVVSDKDLEQEFLDRQEDLMQN